MSHWLATKEEVGKERSTGGNALVPRNNTLTKTWSHQQVVHEGCYWGCHCDLSFFK